MRRGQDNRESGLVFSNCTGCPLLWMTWKIQCLNKVTCNIWEILTRFNCTPLVMIIVSTYFYNYGICLINQLLASSKVHCFSNLQFNLSIVSASGAKGEKEMVFFCHWAWTHFYTASFFKIQQLSLILKYMWCAGDSRTLDLNRTKQWKSKRTLDFSSCYSLKEKQNWSLLENRSLLVSVFASRTAFQ